MPATTPADQQQIAALVEQLGDNSFQQRELAMEKLVAIGPPAEAAVAAALDSSDPEVSYRAAKTLREIERSQLAQRREAFLAGDVNAMKLNAKSWQRMEKLIGNTRKARELFVQMQIEGEDILTASEHDPAGCAALVAGMYNQDQLIRRGGGPGLPAGVVAAMVFAGSADKVSLDSATVSRCSSLLYRHRGTLGESEPFRRLLGQWVREKAEGTQQYQLLRLAQQFKLEEGVELARKMINDGRHSSYKAHAMLTLGMIGDKEDLAALEKQIENNTTVGTVSRSGNKRIQCRLGDIALGMCLALTEQNAKEYGFPVAPNGRPTSTSYYNYGFVDDATRKTAREKWTAWKAEQASKK